MLKSGDCLLIETNRNRFGDIRKHLFVIVLEPQGETKLTIIVSIETLNTKNKKQDQTTILESGDYDNDFIHRTSYVNYRRAKIRSIDELEALLKNRVAKKYPPFREDVFNRICAGILKSSFTPHESRDLYQDHLYRMMNGLH